MKIGELVAYLRTDASGWDKGLTVARASMKKLADESDAMGKRGSSAMNLLSTSLGVVAKAGAGLAGLNGGVQAIGGLVGVATTASGALLLLPAAAGAGALAMGTLKLGVQGFGDAMKNLDDPAKFAEAVAKLAPAAREAAVAVKELQPAWKALQQDVQQQLFEGLGEKISGLGTRYIPILQTAMRGLAADMNFAAQQTAGVFDNDEAAGQMTAALGNVRTAFGQVMEAVAPLSDALLNIFTVGAEFLPGLTAGAGDAAIRFAEWTDNADNLHRIISGGLDAIGKLGQVVGNVGSIIGGVFNAANVSGGGFLNNLVMITGQIAAMINSAQGQETLTQLFAIGAQLSQILMQALQALLPVLPPLVAALGQVAIIIGQALAQAITFIAPYLQMFAEWAAANPGVLVTLAAAIGTLVVAFQGLSMLGTVAGWAISAASAISKIKEAFTLVTTAFNLLKVAFMTNPWLLLIGATIALVTLIVSNWDTIKAALAAAWEWIKSTAETVWNAISSFFTSTWDAISNVFSSAWENLKSIVQGGIDTVKGIINWFAGLPGMIGGWFAGVASAASGKINELISWVAGIPGRVLSALGNIGSFLLSSGSALVQGFLDGIVAAWNRVVSFVQQGVQWVRDLFPFSPAKTGPFSGHGYVTYSGKALTGDFAESLRKGQPGIIAAARDALSAAHGELNAPLSLSAGTPGAATPDARLAAAGATTGGATISITINNPTAERASDSINRRARTLAALGPF